MTRVLKLIKSEEQSKKETELVGLIEDFYNQYQSLYVLYGRLTGEYAKSGPPSSRRPKRVSLSSFSFSSSDSEYFSSEEIEFNNNERYSTFVNNINTLHALKSNSQSSTTETNRKLELEVENQAREIKQLRVENAELEVLVSTQKCKFEEKMKRSRNIKKEFSVMHQNIKELEAQLAETSSAERNLLQEKECLVEKINELCSRENELEENLRDTKEKYEKEVKELECLIGEKEEKELVLREKVWKLEGEVSKEGGEKMNLMKAVMQLERRVERLEKNVKEKDEELVGLGEQKREAIRQLCFLVEFHRDRSLYLKDLMLKLRVKNKTLLC